MSIYNAAGRAVSRFRIDASMAAPSGRGSAVTEWRARDERGRALPSGCYSVVADTGQGRVVKPLIVIR